MKLALFGLVLVALLVVAAFLYGHHQWDGGTRQLRALLAGARMPMATVRYDAAETMELPAPVRRYFSLALREGQAMVASVELEHRGTFNMGETAPQWKEFQSTQYVVMQKPGFDWNGTILMMPGLPVYVHDAYVVGQGILRAEMAGLFTLADMAGTPEAAEGELMRFLAEAAWYPTRLLPSQGVVWEAVDEKRARATLVDGGTRVQLEFRFGEDGLIAGVRAAARYRTVGKRLEAAPWEGRFWAYREHDGMKVPMEGEVSWILPAGPWPYWRGRITQLRYEYEH